MNNEDKLLDLMEKMYGELQGVRKEVKDNGNRLDNIETRLDGMDNRLDGVETRLDNMDIRLDHIEDAEKTIMYYTIGVDRQITEISKTIKEHDNVLDRYSLKEVTEQNQEQ